MEIRTLRYFLAVAREENMTRAASLLHVTQPTLSKQLKSLEDELGKKLFIRHSFRISLTEEGILLRINRSIQAEGVFGITKQDMGHDRFLRRGKQGVLTEYLLLAFGFNINKLHHRIQEGRLGQQLLIPEKAG